MKPKYSPDAPVVIQARITHLRNRKRVLDELIACLERYAVYELPPPRLPAARCSPGKDRLTPSVTDLAGAA